MDDLDDSDQDPDYKEKASDSDSDEDLENIEQEQPEDGRAVATEVPEVRIYMDPPVERPDGDTDRDSGKLFGISTKKAKKSLVTKYLLVCRCYWSGLCCGSAIDRDPIFYFEPVWQSQIRIRSDPKLLRSGSVIRISDLDPDP